MCGIAGVAALNGSLDPVIVSAVPNMTDSLRHRGPDGEGFFRDARVVFGHRRLAIIDRAGGKQPLSNEDGTVWVTFNGEIYNHSELREKLTARGHRFRTRSDTEAIVHAYEEFGSACVDQFEGMFAFAVYDQRAGEVFAARDRLGKKPLYYALLGDTLHFASEIKAMKASPAWDPEIDWLQLESYLSLGYILAPNTIYRHVRQVEPGHWLRLSNGRLEVRQYWDVPRFDDFRGSERDAVRLVDEHLVARVAERLESDVPLGAFLSGGIDSGLVVSAMASLHSGPVVTTSVGFGDARHNELAAAGITAAHLGTSHHPHVVTPLLEQILSPMVSAFDEPFADSSSVPTWYVSREARRHVTVALSGDGGDETFGGYDFRYVPHNVEARLRMLLPAAARRAAGFAGEIWPRSHRLPRALRLGTFLENIGRDGARAYYADLCFMKPHVARALMGREPTRDPMESPAYAAVAAHYNRCDSASPVQRAEYADLKVYLANDVLVKVDRMSMQHSLEVRCPLLDRRLVEFAFSLPQSLKKADQTGKHLLKEVARRRLPQKLLSFPKRGFTAPVGFWLAGPYREQFREEALSETSSIAALLDVRCARRMFDRHLSGQVDHSYDMWALWLLERWSRAESAVPSPAITAECNARIMRNHELGGVTG